MLGNLVLLQYVFTQRIQNVTDQKCHLLVTTHIAQHYFHTQQRVS